MIISLVVAVANNNAIGANNSLLWHLPNDLRFFKNTTWGMPIIMGRKTFQSIACKPLSGRLNIVVTRDRSLLKDNEGIKIADSFEEALKIAKDTDCKEAFVIGGGEIYNFALPQADRIYLTRVDALFPDATVFFPLIDNSIFRLISLQAGIKDEKNIYEHSFEIWERIKEF